MVFNAAVQQENLDAVRSNEVAPLESTLGITGQIAQIEFKGSTQHDTATRTEDLSAVIKDASEQIEASSDLQSASRIPVEMLKSVTLDRAIRDEVLGGVAREAIAAPESLAGQRSDAAAQAEWEAQEGFSAGAAVPLEAISDVARDAVAADETLGGVASDFPAEAENMVQFASSSGVEAEWLGSFVVTIDGVALLEFLAGQQTDFGGQIESLADVATDATALPELLSEVIGSNVVQVEGLSDMLGDGALQLEITASTDNASGNAPFEFLATWITDVAGASEVLLDVSGDTPAATEQLTGSVTDIAALAELISSLVSDSIAETEFEATFASTGGDGLVQLEIVGSIFKSDSGVQVEIQQINRGRGNQNQLHSVLVSGIRLITRS